MNDKDLIQEAKDVLDDLLLPSRVIHVLNDFVDALEARQVDEAKLAEVIDSALIRHGEMAGMSNQERWDARDDIARAVVEFLGERHEPESGKVRQERDAAVAAKALEEAASAWQVSGWAHDMPEKGAERAQVILHTAQAATEMLRLRAAEYRKGQGND